LAHTQDADVAAAAAAAAACVRRAGLLLFPRGREPIEYEALTSSEPSHDSLGMQSAVSR
jgi:hypothetical protein